MHNVRSGCGWPSAGASRASGMFPRAPLSWKPRAETAQKSAMGCEMMVFVERGEVTGTNEVTPHDLRRNLSAPKARTQVARTT